MAFGERLQEVRRRAGLTQEQFAAELNVSRQAVSKWESCRGYPEIEKILYICNRYQVSLDELFSQEVPRQAPAQPAPDTPPLPEKTLKTALSAFFANLSPREKWLGLGAVAGTLALALALGLCLKGGTTDMMTIIWIAAMVIFGVVEAVTVGLASIWFVVGSVAGLIAAICGGPVWLQIALFFVVSIVCLAATRPSGEEAAAQGRYRHQRRPRPGPDGPGHRVHRQRRAHRGGVCGRHDLDGPQRKRPAHSPQRTGEDRPYGGRAPVRGARVSPLQYLT